MDESGRFQHPDSDSRFYIVSLILHDQAVDLSPARGLAILINRPKAAAKQALRVGQSPMSTTAPTDADEPPTDTIRTVSKSMTRRSLRRFSKVSTESSGFDARNQDLAVWLRHSRAVRP